MTDFQVFGHSDLLQDDSNAEGSCKSHLTTVYSISHRNGKLLACICKPEFFLHAFSFLELLICVFSEHNIFLLLT